MTQKDCGCYNGPISETDCRWYSYVCTYHRFLRLESLGPLPKMAMITTRKRKRK